MTREPLGTLLQRVWLASQTLHSYQAATLFLFLSLASVPIITGIHISASLWIKYALISSCCRLAS